jgi:hypothetical protein
MSRHQVAAGIHAVGRSRRRARLGEQPRADNNLNTVMRRQSGQLLTKRALASGRRRAPKEIDMTWQIELDGEAFDIESLKLLASVCNVTISPGPDGRYCIGSAQSEPKASTVIKRSKSSWLMV